ncbi:MAG: ABC transporter permease, partial [Oscillospiraceae bacterium]|nr:ABC transporter permease [Oscillospiraceae bacterium]
MKKRTFGTLFILFVLVFIYAPIVILAFYSFTNASQIGAFQTLSLKNYVTLFSTEELRQMIFGTITLAIGASLLATLLGTLGAMGSFYSVKRVNTFFDTVNQVPVINADVVSGFSACILLVVVMGIGKETYIPLVIGETILCAPFVYLSV